MGATGKREMRLVGGRQEPGSQSQKQRTRALPVLGFEHSQQFSGELSFPTLLQTKGAFADLFTGDRPLPLSSFPGAGSFHPPCPSQASPLLQRHSW